MNKNGSNSQGASGTEADQEQKPQVFTAVSLSYDKKKDILKATLAHTDADPGINYSSLLESILEKAPDLYQVPEPTLEKLLRMVQNGETGTVPLEKSPVYTLVELSIDVKGQVLNATLTGTLENPKITQQSLQQTIVQNGYEDLYFEKNAVNGLFALIQKNGRGVYPIAERKNAEVAISMDKEKMSALISTTQSFGGKKLTAPLIKAAIRNAGIKPEFCALAALKQALERPVTALKFAKGKDPINGLDTQFNALVDEVVYHAPVINKKTGKADHATIKDFTIVDVGEPVMQRTPATEGTHGSNVLGEVIPAEPGEEIPFSKESQDVIVDPNDLNKFIADAKGHPVIMTDGVKVDKTLKVENVDIRTGNITFDGSLLIIGEVAADMEINVTGDVIVSGIVASAHITAGNDITIKGGVIGSEEDAAKGKPLAAKLRAGGNIKAQFVSLADLNAKHNIEVAAYIAHSQVFAKDSVLIGQSGGKGSLFGGRCHAENGVIANIVGTDADVRTLVSVGSGTGIQKEIDNLGGTKESLNTQAEQLCTVFNQYMTLYKKKALSQEKLEKAKVIKNTVESIKQKIETTNAEIGTLELQMKQAKSSDIIVKKTIFANVLVVVNGIELPIRKEMKGGHFVQQGKDIKWSGA